MIDFTVAIPTYNGEQRLPEVLERLRSQIGTEAIVWEILVIDNNSQDGTKAVVQAFQTNFFRQIHYCLEPKQGASYARNRAIREAQSDLIGFLDDDNLPDADWVIAAYQFAQTHPDAGAYGSQIRGLFEATPPQNFNRILPFLAITERGSKPLLYAPQNKLLPPSAGLVVRRQAWLKNVPETGALSRLKFKRSDGNDCGEDIEALSYIQQSHWEIWYNADMKISHKISSKRLERGYLLALFQSIGLSRYVTRMAGVKPWQKPFLSFAYMASDLKKIIVHLIKYRTQIKTDLIVACEMQLFINSLISPFYLLTINVAIKLNQAKIRLLQPLGEDL